MGDFIFVKKLVYKPQPQTPALAAAPSDPPNLKELDSVQKGGLRRDKLYFVDNTSTEEWRTNNLRFFLHSSEPEHVILFLASPEGYQDTPDFNELEWVNANSFQGLQTLQGKSCYFYKLADQSAWIDKATSLPVYFESKWMQVTYFYKSPPNQPLQLPEIFQKKLKHVQKAWTGQSN